jgi:hypothetical protein
MKHFLLSLFQDDAKMARFVVEIETFVSYKTRHPKVSNITWFSRDC